MLAGTASADAEATTTGTRDSVSDGSRFSVIEEPARTQFSDQDACGDGTKAKHSDENAGDDQEFRKLLEAMTNDHRRQMRDDDMEIMKLIRSMGGSSRRFQRERRQQVRANIS